MWKNGELHHRPHHTPLATRDLEFLMFILTGIFIFAIMRLGLIFWLTFSLRSNSRDVLQESTQ